MKIKLPKGLDIEDLRWRRDLASRNGDIPLAFACALAIDKIKYGKPTARKAPATLAAALISAAWFLAAFLVFIATE